MSEHLLDRSAVVERLRHLAATLAGLKDRVREAVAAETGRAVADAVKDLLTAALGGRPVTPSCRRPEASGDRPAWADEDDRWYDDEDNAPDYRPHAVEREKDDVPPPRAGGRSRSPRPPGCSDGGRPAACRRGSGSLSPSRSPADRSPGPGRRWCPRRPTS